MIRRRLLFVLLLLCCAAAVCCGCAREQAKGLELFVTPFDGTDSTRIVCSCGSDGVYTLFLPAGADRNALYVRYTGGEITCDGAILPNKAVTDFFSDKEEYTLARGEERFTLRVMQSENLPAIYIETKKPLSWLHEDKANKSQGTITVTENGVSTQPLSLKHIKGRGNSTWEIGSGLLCDDKRPYNLKLEEASSLLGLAKAKKYRLLANLRDTSLIRNAAALELAREMGVSGAIDCRQVDLYFNGDYRGNYLLTEAIDAGEGRVEINDTEELNEAANRTTDLERFPLSETHPSEDTFLRWRELPAVPERSSWAFLLEQDVKNEDEDGSCVFFDSFQRSITLKNPENASREQVEYAASVYRDAQKALLAADGFNAKGEYYTDRVDEGSVARVFLIQELFDNHLGAAESLFCYIPENSGRLVMGPVWDFDLAAADRDSRQWTLCTSRYGGVSWFSAAFRHEDFRRSAEDIWREFRSRYPSDRLLAFFADIAQRNEASVAMDRCRWELEKEIYSVWGSYKAVYTWLADAIEARAQTLDAGFSENAAFVWYVFDEKNFFMEPKILQAGDTVTLPTAEEAEGYESLSLPYKDEELLCWCVSPDGSGQRYNPGDELVLTDRTLTLYAVWR